MPKSHLLLPCIRSRPPSYLGIRHPSAARYIVFTESNEAQCNSEEAGLGTWPSALIGFIGVSEAAKTRRGALFQSSQHSKRTKRTGITLSVVPQAIRPNDPSRGVSDKHPAAAGRSHWPHWTAVQRKSCSEAAWLERTIRSANYATERFA